MFHLFSGSKYSKLKCLLFLNLKATYMANYILANTAHQSNISGFFWTYSAFTKMIQAELNINFYLEPNRGLNSC